MNKRLFFKICSVSVGGFLIVWSAAFTVFLMKDRTRSETNIPQYTAENAQSTIQSAKAVYYIARSDNGRVIIYEVYNNGFEKPVSMPDIDLKQLTEQDKADFEKGIILNDKTALASLLEDFTS